MSALLASRIRDLGGRKDWQAAGNRVDGAHDERCPPACLDRAPAASARRVSMTSG